MHVQTAIVAMARCDENFITNGFAAAYNTNMATPGDMMDMGANALFATAGYNRCASQGAMKVTSPKKIAATATAATGYHLKSLGGRLFFEECAEMSCKPKLPRVAMGNAQRVRVAVAAKKMLTVS